MIYAVLIALPLYKSVFTREFRVFRALYRRRGGRIERGAVWRGFRKSSRKVAANVPVRYPPPTGGGGTAEYGKPYSARHGAAFFLMN